MYNIEKEKLNTIIENSYFSSDVEKNRQVRNAFLAVFSELCDYSKAVNDEIMNRSEEKERTSVLPEIFVTLMDKDDGEKIGRGIGLSSMVDSARRFFLDDEYEEIKRLIGDYGKKVNYVGQYIKDGMAYDFTYYLKFDRSYVERQELIYKYALHYDFSNPVIYSPYSAKAVMLVCDTEIDENKCEVDYKFKENGLKMISCYEKDLFWNISVSNENRTYDAKEPYGDEVRYVFEFSKNKAGNYLLPLPMNNQTKVYEIEFTDCSIKITTDHDMDEFVVLEPLSIDETSSAIKTLMSVGKAFRNSNNYSGIITKRILSEADIEHAIAIFRDNHGIRCKISKGEGIIVRRYLSKYRPNRPDRKLFNLICREYVSFDTDNQNAFMIDYVNYVLEYLEYYYPEIEWVGEI